MRLTRHQHSLLQQGCSQPAPLKLRAALFAAIIATATLAAGAQPPQQPQTSTPVAASTAPQPVTAAPTPASPAPQTVNAAASPAAAQPAVEKPAPPTASSAKPLNEAAQQSEMLLKMANDLWKEVDKSTKDTLSVSVIRKADEIEHFAHEVRIKTNPEVGSK